MLVLRDGFDVNQHLGRSQQSARILVATLSLSTQKSRINLIDHKWRHEDFNVPLICDCTKFLSPYFIIGIKEGVARRVTNTRQT